MCDSTGIHITRIYINCSRQTPSPIRSSTTAPVCTSTPIIHLDSSDPTPQQQMALIAKEVLASKRSSEVFISNPESPSYEQYVFVSKQTGQRIDFTTGDGIGKLMNSNTGTISKKKKTRQSTASIATLSSRSSKSSDDGDNSVPMNNDMHGFNAKKKPNFTSYDGIHMFTFTLDDD